MQNLSPQVKQQQYAKNLEPNGQKIQVRDSRDRQVATISDSQSIKTPNCAEGIWLPNDELEELVLVEDLAVEVQHPDTGPLHAGPGREAQVQPVFQGTLADRDAAFQFRAWYRRKPVWRDR